MNFLNFCSSNEIDTLIIDRDNCIVHKFFSILYNRKKIKKYLLLIKLLFTVSIEKVLLLRKQYQFEEKMRHCKHFNVRLSI